MGDRTFDVAILGGGIIGLSIAYECAGAGLTVLVLERGELGREASSAAAGILPAGRLTATAGPYEQLRGLGSDLYPTWSRDLLETTGIDNGYENCGGLEIAPGPEEASALAEESETWAAQGIDWRRLDPGEARRLEPALSGPIEAAYELPQTSRFEPDRHLAALAAACRLRGGELVSGAGDGHLVTEGERVLGVRTSDGTVHHAGTTVVAAGPWTASVLAGLGIELATWPVRGQIALLKPAGPAPRRLIMFGRRYFVPRAGGRIVLGSTEEEAGFDKRCTVGGIHDLLGAAMALAPSFSEATLETCWAGLRPASPDGLPWLGALPGYRDALVAAGHYRLGLQMAPATARTLCQLIRGETPEIALDPFRLDRAARPAETPSPSRPRSGHLSPDSALASSGSDSSELRTSVNPGAVAPTRTS